MPLFGRKSDDNTNISSPVAGHPISAAPPQPLGMQPATNLDSQDPSAKHPNTNQPAGAFGPKRGGEADTLPAGVPSAGPAPDPLELQRQPGEGATVTVVEKMPFKDQVKAWAKVHRGTIFRDREQKELGQKILAGEVPPQ